MVKKHRSVQVMLRNFPSPPVDLQRMEDTIAGAQKIWNETQQSRRTSWREFYCAQLHFISKKVWALHLFIVLMMSWLLQHALSFESIWINEGQVLMFVSIASPLLVVAGLQVMIRSFSFSMLEIELSTKHSLEKLMLARMSLLSLVDILCLISMSVFFGLKLQQEIGLIFIYLLVPFQLTCLGCLAILSRTRSKDCGIYCLVFIGAQVLVQVILSLFPSLQLYDKSSMGAWIAILLLSMAGLALEVRKLRVSCRSLDTAPIKNIVRG
ncbi:hypothetical protein J7E73_23245 [Paenibacillus albidus]|uniref:hypothetical protein n=1 Tax=Paenibacillus albidus TaxID=2041023 RepID=UPI001BEB8AAD|nr:hypothetical protein [Paenibacillus albidus]MBT2291992.1 hypothetical protein [Paenibacillus albidus]